MSYVGHGPEYCNFCGTMLGRKFVKHKNHSYCTIRCRDGFHNYPIVDDVDQYRGVHVTDPHTTSKE